MTIIDKIINDLTAHPIKIDESNTLYHDCLLNNGKKLSHANVVSIYYRSSESAVYAITVRRESKLIIYYNNDDKAIISHYSAFVGKSMHHNIIKAYSNIGILTHEKRRQIMIEQIEKNGYVEKDGVKFTSDGNIISGNKTINIKLMYEHGEAAQGREFKSLNAFNRSYDPFVIVFGENGIGLFKNKIRYDSCIDTDIIWEVIDYLYNKSK